MKIGVMFGNPETTPGGNALKFYSSVRVEVRRAAKIQSSDKIVGNRVKAKVVKNKVAAPFKVAEFDIMYNEGISKHADIILTGYKYGVITKSGNHYSFGADKLGNGLEASKLALKENKKLEKEVLSALRKKVREI
jgi:recombination protein RecA